MHIKYSEASFGVEGDDLRVLWLNLRANIGGLFSQ